MRTRTVGGVRWECSESEGLWHARHNNAEFRIGRSDRRGRKSEWEIFRNNESKWIGRTCGELMEMVARGQL